MGWLDIVALATVCDVVPLTGVNRAFVVQGLKVLRNRQNAGLKALCDAAGVNKPPSPYTLGFVLGPRINAGGRIGDAGLGARLLASDDASRRRGIAETLDKLNRERREIELKTVEEAAAWADRTLLEDPACPIIIAGSPAWHKGLVGLAASRLDRAVSAPLPDFLAGRARGRGYRVRAFRVRRRYRGGGARRSRGGRRKEGRRACHGGGRDGGAASAARTRGLSARGASGRPIGPRRLRRCLPWTVR